MARPTDPTSQNQVEKRANRLRSEESGWTESLSLAMAREQAWIGELLKESRTET